MTRSSCQLEKDRITNRLQDIAQKIHTYFVQLKKNVMPLKEVIDQLKQSYPEAMADRKFNFEFIILIFYFSIIYFNF